MSNPFEGLSKPIIDRPGTPPAVNPALALAVREGTRKKRAREDTLPHIATPWSLTPTECFILAQMSEGDTGTDIAGVLSLSNKTVSTYLARAVGKMKARNGQHAAVIYDRFIRGAQGVYPVGEVTLRICGGLVVAAEQKTVAAS